MKHFTPELYLRFNSTDEDDATSAEEAWENAILEYKRSLKMHRSRMPANVRTLAEKCCFHDAALLGWQAHEQSNGRTPKSPRLGTIGLQLHDETIVLCYFLTDLPKEKKRRKTWPFSAEQKHWLYDEVAIADPVRPANQDCVFVHRILWSDGSELEVPFVDLVVDRFPAMTTVRA